MLSIINDTECEFSFFFSVDNLNKSTNGTNYVGTIDAGRGVIIGYVWVYLK